MVPYLVCISAASLRLEVIGRRAPTDRQRRLAHPGAPAQRVMVMLDAAQFVRLVDKVIDDDRGRQSLPA